MSNTVYGYMFLIFLLFACGMFTSKLVELHVRREKYLDMYKPGSVERERLIRLLSPYVLIASIVATLVACCLLVATIFVTGQKNDLLFALIFLVIVIIIGFATVPRLVSGSLGTGKK